MEENVHGGRDTQISAKNLETPYESPAVGMELGRGGVYLREQFFLEGSERQTHAHSPDYCLVKEEERSPPGFPRVHTDGYPGFHPAYQDVSVMAFMEGVEAIVRRVPPVGLHVLGRV